jgi:hypothetical protein
MNSKPNLILMGIGVDTNRQVAIYRRSGADDHGKLQHCIIVLNFFNSPRNISVHFPENGQWADLLSDSIGSW